ncbi:MAG: D-alanine--D-alanine ligase [Gammaproteobacteria bacterium]|nr:D-alanine--D-alanine ligase [Gammaproteobacteria bacterium]
MQDQELKNLNHAEYGKVAVLMGGWSAEREVSLNSGNAVLAGLRRKGVDAHGVDVGLNILDQLERGGFDRAFVVLHGRGGEDGVIQGAMETLKLPYTGSGVLGSALGMDKLRGKMLWQAEGIPTPPCRVLENEMDLERVEDELGFPLMIKPVHEGSSLGIHRVADGNELQSAWLDARGFDREVMAERCIQGEEYTAAILVDRVLPLIRLETPRAFYDYHAKYADDRTRYICPCGLSRETEEDFQGQALRAFTTLGAYGWGRVDFLCDEEGKPWFIEINTVPGMTDHSLVPMAAAAEGMDFDTLTLRILETAVRVEI